MRVQCKCWVGVCGFNMAMFKHTCAGFYATGRRSPRGTPMTCDVWRPAESPSGGWASCLSSGVARPGLRALGVELQVRDRVSAGRYSTVSSKGISAGRNFHYSRLAAKMADQHGPKMHHVQKRWPIEWPGNFRAPTKSVVGRCGPTWIFIS